MPKIVPGLQIPCKVDRRSVIARNTFYQKCKKYRTLQLLLFSWFAQDFQKKKLEKTCDFVEKYFETFQVCQYCLKTCIWYSWQELGTIRLTALNGF